MFIKLKKLKYLIYKLFFYIKYLIMPIYYNFKTSGPYPGENEFAKIGEQFFIKEDINWKKGIHCAFVHTYGKNSNYNLFGKNCLILGKECSTNKYNFIGGKVEGIPNQYNMAKTLYRELCEEFGSVPNPNFFDSILYCCPTGKSNNSLLLIVNISGISTTILNKMIKFKSKLNLPGCFQELKSIDHIPFDNINSLNSSGYVMEYINLISIIFPKNHTKTIIFYNDVFIPFYLQ